MARRGIIIIPISFDRVPPIILWGEVREGREERERGEEGERERGRGEEREPESSSNGANKKTKFLVFFSICLTCCYWGKEK